MTSVSKVSIFKNVSKNKEIKLPTHKTFTHAICPAIKNCRQNKMPRKNTNLHKKLHSYFIKQVFSWDLYFSSLIFSQWKLVEQIKWAFVSKLQMVERKHGLVMGFVMTWIITNCVNLTVEIVAELLQRYTFVSNVDASVSLNWDLLLSSSK